MSGEARPISAEQFAQAIEDLPIENIYAKANEIQNSIAHLQQSNTQLQDYSDSIKTDVSLDEATRSEGDRDCLDAIRENEVVIRRQQERIDLLKKEVERRGGRWHEADMNRRPTANGTSGETHNGSESETASSRPRLSDDELARQLAAQLDNDDEEGLHL